MKIKLLLSTTLLFLTVNTYAQNVGINGTGATPDASAMLDVVSTSRGLLIPRVALTATNTAGPITTPLTSLLVYNTATAGASPNNVLPGYYYWDGTVWVNLSGGAGGKNWGLLGNSGTTAGTNFIGTTDAIDVVLKANNTEGMRIANASGNIGINNTSPTTAKLMVNSTSNTFDGITATHTSASVGSAYHAIRGNITNPAYTTANGYLGYHNSSNATYGVYGTNGDYAAVFSNKTYVGNGLPSTTINTADLEISNIVAGAGNPANLTLRQSTSLTTAGADIGFLNFSDNYLAAPQASIRAARDVTSSSVADLPTRLTFHTTTDASATLTERMRIDNVGRVGIGTTNPIEKLHIGAGNIFLDNNQSLRWAANTDGANITFNSTGDAAGLSALTIETTDNSDEPILFKQTGNERMRIHTNGSIGIGTTTPANKLEITHGTAGNSGLRFTNLTSAAMLGTNATGDVIGIVASPSNGAFWGLTGNSGTTAGSNFIGTTDGIDFITRTNNNERMRVLSNGNVGISITAPVEKLHIGTGNIMLDNNQSLKWAANTDGANITFNSTGDAAGLSALTIETTDNSDEPILFKQTGNERMRIHTNGNVGIGTTTPTRTLDVTSSQTTTAIFTSTAGDPFGTIQLVVPNTNTACNTCSELIVFSKADGTTIGYVNADLTGNSVAYNTTSDIRLKENIRTTIFGINDLMKINVADYNRIGNASTLIETGYIAQQLHTIYPQAVTPGGENAKINPWGVDYGKITPLIVKAVQDVNNELEILKKQRSNDRLTIDLLLKRIETLEKK